VDDLKLIVSVGVFYVNFLGIISEAEAEAVRLINELNSKNILLEIIQLELK